MRLSYLLLLLLSFSLPLSVQGLKITQSKADCNVFESKFDNPFSDTRGWEMRRVYWHLGYAVASDFIANEIHDRLHVPLKVATIGTALGIGLIPHIRSGIIRRDNPINPMDWVFDLNNRSLPIYLDQSSKVLGISEYLVSYGATMCWSSP